MTNVNPDAVPHKKTARSLLGRLLGTYLRPYLRLLAAAVFFMVLAAVMTATFAKLIEPVIDNISAARRADLIVPLGLAVFAVFVVSGLATYFHTLLMNRIGQSIVADVQNDLFARLMTLDLGFFHANPGGLLISRIVNDTHVMRGAVADGVTGVGKGVLTLVLLVALMFTQNAMLATVIFVIFPITAFFVMRIGKRLRKISGAIQGEIANLTYTLAQTFQGIRQVKAYGMEDSERARAGKVIARVRDLSIKSTRVGTLSTPINEALVGLAVMGVIVIGGYQVVVSQTLTTGQLFSFITAFSLAYEPMKRLAKLNNTIQTGLGAAERVFALMDQEPEICERAGALVFTSRQPEIRFEDVTFRYPGQEEGAALQNVAFTLPAGKVTALVGPSGAGKSTVMNLIPRLFDAQQGAVTIDGVDVRNFTLSSLRRHIAIVSQDISIFDDSAAANIRYGTPDASDEAVREAARRAAAHEFIMALPQGYDTPLGENGVKLSGGQRQRLAIARAILRDAPILLLDEATSALDNESERLIQQSLAELQKGRTTLVIAHRLSTIHNADQIIVMKDGAVVQQGRHDRLLGEREGLYARLHTLGQMG